MEDEDDLLDLGFEDFKRAMKIFDDKELPNKDPGELHWREQQILAQREFDDGKAVQAIIILHGLIEININRFSMWVSACNNFDREEEIDTKEKTYKKSLEFLEKENALDEETIRNLKEFNQLRNSMSHNLYGAKQRTPHKKELKNKFEIGLHLSGMLPLIELKYLHDQEKAGNKFAKKMLEFLTTESEKELKEKYGDDYESRLT